MEKKAYNLILIKRQIRYLEFLMN